MPFDLPTYDAAALAQYTDIRNNGPTVALKQLVGVPFVVRSVVTYIDKRDDTPKIRMTAIIDSFPLDEQGDVQPCTIYTQSKAMMAMIYNIATQVGKIVTPSDTLVIFTEDQAPHLTVEDSPTGYGHVFQSLRSKRAMNGVPLTDKLFDYESYAIAQAAYLAKKQAAQAPQNEQFPL